MTTLSIKERANRAAEQRRAEELQRRADQLYTDEQFRRNGYGHYDSCPLPARDNNPLPDGWSVTESDRGVWVSFDGYAVDCVPGTAQAYTKIANGEYLTEGECCPVRYSYSPVDEFGTQEVACYSDSDETIVVKQPACSLTIGQKLMHYMGYPVDEFWLMDDYYVLTLDGDECIGTIDQPYQPHTSYLSEAEYESCKHLMEF